MTLLRSIAGLLAVVCAFLGSAGAGQEHGPSLDSLRARWERFTPEQKERARERYERYLAMSEEEREQLAQSAQRLRQRADRVQEEIEARAPDRIAALPPETKRAIARELVAEQSREIGARIRSRVPGHWIERIQNARPEDRARFLRQFQVQQRDRVARFAIGELGRKLEMPGEEIARLQEQPGEERGKKVLELRQRLSALEVHEHGLPPGITPEQWEAWLALPPEDFFEVFQRYWLSRVEQVPKSPEMVEALGELHDAARPRVEEVLALADLTSAERWNRIAASKRERCLQVIRERALLSSEEIDALAAKGNHEFFEGVRRLLRTGRRVGTDDGGRRPPGGAQPPSSPHGGAEIDRPKRR
jgi:hypothetical protein